MQCHASAHSDAVWRSVSIQRERPPSLAFERQGCFKVDQLVGE